MTPPDERTRRQARFPHELLMINLALFHLLLAPAAIALGVGAWGLLPTPLLSGAVIAYLHVRSRRTAEPFVRGHWQLAWRRGRLLLLAYAVSAAVIGGGWLLARGAATASMGDIVFTIATRIGVMPTAVMVLVVFVLENSALELANRGEVPPGLAAGG